MSIIKSIVCRECTAPELGERNCCRGCRKLQERLDRSSSQQKLAKSTKEPQDKILSVHN